MGIKFVEKKKEMKSSLKSIQENPFWSFPHLKAILTQNIQTTLFIQITSIVKVSKHKPFYIQPTFSYTQFYKINLIKINFFHR